MFYIISFLLVSIGIIALPLIEGVNSSLILASTVFTIGFILTQLIKKFYFSKNIVKLLAFIVLLVGIVGSFSWGNSGEWAIIWLIWYFILVFQIVSIFGYKDAKSWAVSYFLSFVQLSLGGIFTENLLFLAIFSIYLILAVFGFLFLLPKIEMREKILKLIKPRLNLAKWGVLTTVNVFFVTGLVFLVLPRTQSPFFKIKKEMHLVESLKESTSFMEDDVEEKALSLPDEIELGTVSELRSGNSILMLVEAKKPSLLKAQTFNYYNGRSWIKHGSKPVPIKLKDGKVNLKPLYLKKELFAKTAPDKFYHQKFYIKNYSQNLVLGSYPIISLFGLDAEEIKIDHFENIYLQKKLKSGDQYEVISVDKNYSSNYLRSLPRTYPKEIMELYLQLPPDLDKRLMDLTSYVLKYTPSNIYDELITIRKYLKDHCVYSRLTKESSTFYEFLFDNKPGDCEYFATALALMLRYRNIPTRLVTGFSGGEFDSKKRTAIVYAKNAHAWIEVFFPNIGWLPCDATPKSIFQVQWEEEPKVLASKYRKDSKDKGFSSESSNENEASNSDYSKQSGASDKITEEGTPEEELLPEDYYFKDKLSQSSLPKEEVVFSGEFFEKADSSGSSDLEKESEEIALAQQTEIFKEEDVLLNDNLLNKDFESQEVSIAEEEDWLYKEDSAVGKGITEEELQPEADLFEEIILSEDEEESVEELVSGEELFEKEDLTDLSSEEDRVEFSSLESKVEEDYFSEESVSESEAVLGGEDIVTSKYSEEQGSEIDSQDESLLSVEDRAIEEASTESEDKDADGVFLDEESLTENSLEDKQIVAASGVVEDEESLAVSVEEDLEKDALEEVTSENVLSPEVALEEITSESKDISQVQLEPSEIETLEEDIVASLSLIGEEETPTEVEESTLEEAISTFQEQSSFEDEILEQDVLASEGFISEEELSLEKETFPDQYIQDEDSIVVEDFLSEPGIDSEDSAVADEESGDLTESSDIKEDFISDLGIIAEEPIFEEDLTHVEDLILEKSAEDRPSSEELMSKDEYIELGEDVAVEKLDVVEEVELEEVKGLDREYLEENSVSLAVEEDMTATAMLSEDLEEEVASVEEDIEPSLNIIERDYLESAIEVVEEDLEESLKGDVLFDDNLEKVIAGRVSIEPEEIIEEDLEAGDMIVEDMIPDDNLTSAELGLLLEVVKDKLKEWTLEFSNYTQALIFDFIEGVFRVIKDFIYSIVANIYNYLKQNRKPYSVTIVVIILAYLLWLFLKESIRKKREEQQLCRIFPQRKLTKEEKKVRSFYFQVLDLLAKAGYKRLPHLTPREFAYQLIAKGFSISKDFYHLTDMFYRISFGQIELELQELNRVDVITASIREWTKEIKG